MSIGILVLAVLVVLLYLSGITSLIIAANSHGLTGRLPYALVPVVKRGVAIVSFCILAVGVASMVSGVLHAYSGLDQASRVLPTAHTTTTTTWRA